MSTAVKSAKDLNCALVWSLRKVSTGMTPSGWIQISNSLKQDTCRHETGGRDNKELPRKQLTGADSPDLRQRKKPELGWRIYGAFLKMFFFILEREGKGEDLERNIDKEKHQLFASSTALLGIHPTTQA